MPLLPDCWLTPVLLIRIGMMMLLNPGIHDLKDSLPGLTEGLDAGPRILCRSDSIE